MTEAKNDPSAAKTAADEAFMGECSRVAHDLSDWLMKRPEAPGVCLGALAKVLAGYVVSNSSDRADLHVKSKIVTELLAHETAQQFVARSVTAMVEAAGKPRQ